MKELLRFCGSFLLGTATAVSLKYFGVITISGTIFVSVVVFSYLFVFIVRFFVRFRKMIVDHFIARFGGDIINVLIIGDETTASQVNEWCVNQTQERRHPIGILSDDSRNQGLYIQGIKVVGTLDDLKKTVDKYSVDEIIIASGASVSTIRMIYHLCKQHTKCDVLIASEYMHNDTLQKDMQLQVRNIRLEDLLCREEVSLNMKFPEGYIRNQTVLVTGGAGSIGSEICKQVLTFGAKKLIIYDIHENGLFQIQNMLLATFDPQQFEVVMGSVRDIGNLDYVFSKYKPDLVFHAAAHKHVPMMEINPYEAVKNNVFGTLNVCDAAIKYHVKKMVLISTDKAVNPTSVMGATKRIAELVVQLKNRQNDVQFSAVRFGNVLGSNGSVVPTFREQIEKGGPVTVTHTEIERYFMTIPEAVSLVIQTGYMSEGGEIFLLDMGKPVKIYDLACEMIRLCGLIPQEDIEIEITGLRPGEKMYEELHLYTENVCKTDKEKIFLLQSADGSQYDTELTQYLEKLKVLCQKQEVYPKKQLHECIMGMVECVNAQV